MIPRTTWHALAVLAAVDAVLLVAIILLALL